MAVDVVEVQSSELGGVDVNRAGNKVCLFRECIDKGCNTIITINFREASNKVHRNNFPRTCGTGQRKEFAGGFLS